MGAGVSISSNVAEAVAGAYTNVLNNTNVTYTQDVGQTESIGLNNCDVFVGQDLTFNQNQSLNTAMEMTANVEDTTDISNDIAQTLSQMAESSVGEMAIGYAGASNVASSFANMNTQISNYVSQSATTITNESETFDCTNSTITVGGSFNLSQYQTTSVSGSVDTDVVNTTTVQNTISQSISQTASATTGMDMWTFLILGIVAIVGIVIFKVLESRDKRRAMTDPNIRNCVMAMEKDNKTLKGGAKPQKVDVDIHVDQQGRYNAALAECPDCVTRCIEVNHASHLYVPKWVFIVWILILLGFGVVIGTWYGLAATTGCIHNDSCGSTQSTMWASGCSCNLEDAALNPTAVCNAPIAVNFTGTGAPVKYQYPLLQSWVGVGTDNLDSASMQGILISSLKLGQSTYNSNNGRNLYTLLTYESLWESGALSSQIQGMFSAAAATVLNNQDEFQRLYKVMESVMMGSYSESSDLTEYGHVLFQYLNPLRLPTFDTSNTMYSYLEEDSSYISQEDVIGTKVLPVPAAFRYNLSESITNLGFGCCSLSSMEYVSSQDVSFGDVNEIGDCNDTADDFCSTNRKVGYPDIDSSTYLTLNGNANNSIIVSDLVANLSNFNSTTQDYVFQDSSGNVFTPLDVYCRISDLGDSTDSSNQYSHDYGLMRLLYAGILSTQKNVGDSASMWGVNALISTGSLTTTYDFAYAAGFIWPGESSISSCDSVVAKCPELDAGELPSQVIIIDAPDATYSVTNGMGMSTTDASTLDGQSYTATSSSIGYCRTTFVNESMLVVIWIVFVFWLLLLPAYLLIRYYIGESQSQANKRDNEIRGTSSNSKSPSSSTAIVPAKPSVSGGAMGYECTKPYDPQTASKKDRVQSCTKVPGGKYGSSRQVCVENCTA